MVSHRPRAWRGTCNTFGRSVVSALRACYYMPFRLLLLVIITTALLRPGAAPPPANTVSEWRARRGLLDSAKVGAGATDDSPGEAMPSESGRPSTSANVHRSWAGSCCATPGPGRWCCRDGKRCCPPKALPQRAMLPAMPIPGDTLSEPIVGPLSEGLRLLFEEAVSGLIGTCRALEISSYELAQVGSPVTGKGLPEPLKIPAGANLREKAEGACRVLLQDMDVNISEAQCIRQYAQAAVMQALSPGNALTGGQAVYLIGRSSADEVCTQFRRGVRAVAAASNSTALRRHVAPPLAFRWLKLADAAGMPLFIPRHPRGQVLVSNAFRFIYVHVPKAASTTVRALLWEREGIDDLVYSHLDKYQRETFLTFAFVRDPLRRFISAYDEVCLKLGPTCRFYDAAGPGGLRAFLSYTRAHPCWDEHVCDQMSFLTAGDGRMMRFDVLASTAELAPTLMHVSSVLGFDPPLSVESVAQPRNVGSRTSAADMLVSAPDIVRGVCELYAQDYAVLGFELPAACRAQGPEEKGDGGEEGGPRGEGTAFAAIYPAEWHDTDLGLAALARGTTSPALLLMQSYTESLAQLGAERLHCGARLLLDPDEIDIEIQSSSGDATLDPAPDQDANAAPDQDANAEARRASSGDCARDEAGMPVGADRSGGGERCRGAGGWEVEVVGGLEQKAESVRAFVASTLLRQHLESSSLVLPCCMHAHGGGQRAATGLEGGGEEERDGEEGHDGYARFLWVVSGGLCSVGSSASSGPNTTSSGPETSWTSGPETSWCDQQAECAERERGASCRSRSDCTRRLRAGRRQDTGPRRGVSPGCAGEEATKAQASLCVVARQLGAARQLVKQAGGLDVSREHGAMWARAVTLQWLWRPPASVLQRALQRIKMLAHGPRILEGQHVALVMPACTKRVRRDAYPHASNNPCTHDKGWRHERLDVAPETCKGLYAHLHEPVPVIIAVGRPLISVCSISLLLLRCCMLQMRAASAEGALLDLLVVITDDTALRDAAQDAEWRATHTSWALEVVYIDPIEDKHKTEAGAEANYKTDTGAREEEAGGVEEEADAEWLMALLLLRHARHLLGSPSSPIFQLGAELVAGEHYTAHSHLRAQRCGDGAGSQGLGAGCAGHDRRVADDGEEIGGWEAGLTRLWSVDVPLGAGGFGFVGANIRPSVRVQDDRQRLWEEAARLGGALGYSAGGCRSENCSVGGGLQARASLRPDLESPAGELSSVCGHGGSEGDRGNAAHVSGQGGMDVEGTRRPTPSSSSVLARSAVNDSCSLVLAGRNCDGDRVSGIVCFGAFLGLAWPSLLYLAVEWDGDCAVRLLEDREYLPSISVLMAARARALLGDPLTQDLRQRLGALQNTPTACARARKARYPNHGAAATMNYLVIQLKRALRDQRPVVFHGPWIYAACAEGDVSCVFRRESVCNASSDLANAHNRLAPGEADGDREDRDQERDWALQSYGVSEHLSGEGRGGMYPDRMQEVDADFVLPIYQAEGKGIFWYNSVVTGYMFRLLPELEGQVSEELEYLGLKDTPFIGVQIRRGDACGQTRPCIDIELYAEAVSRVASTYGISKIYLATDDPHALSELQTALDSQTSGLSVVGQRLDRDFLAANTEQCAALANNGVRTLKSAAHIGCEWIEDKLLRASRDDKRRQALGVVRDIDILARSDAFVGTFTSALNRVAFQLSFARKGYVKPFVSLDIPWCWAGFHLIQVPWGTYGC